MADLLMDFFERDLTDVEDQALADSIASSPPQSLRFAELARDAYLQTGLPNEDGSNGSSGSGTSLRLWGPITLKIILLLSASGFLLFSIYRLLHEPPSPSSALALTVVKKIAPSLPNPVFSKAPALSPLKKAATYPPPLPLTKVGMVKPMAYDLSQKYEGLDIMVEQKNAGLVTVRALNSSGREIRLLFAGMLKQGKWDFQWDGKLDSGPLAQPGTYRVEVQSGKDILSKEVVIQGMPVARQGN